jgi:hypothetical protein
MGNTSSTYLPANKFERISSTRKSIENNNKNIEHNKKAVINKVVKQYNDGYKDGFIEVEFTENEARYCNKLREIIGRDLQNCKYKEEIVKKFDGDVFNTVYDGPERRIYYSFN